MRRLLLILAAVAIVGIVVTMRRRSTEAALAPLNLVDSDASASDASGDTDTIDLTEQPAKVDEEQTTPTPTT